MTFTELITAIRANYVEQLAKAASEQDAHIEPAYRAADGTLSLDGLLSLPCRADLILKMGNSENQPMMVDSSTKLRFEPISFEINSTSIVISPFAWDWMTLQAIGVHADTASQTLKEWFLNWFDIEENNKATPEGLYGVVHFLSDPEPTSDGVRANIDLGSSPGAAFEDLLFRLSDANASEVHIG